MTRPKDTPHISYSYDTEKDQVRSVGWRPVAGRDRRERWAGTSMPAGMEAAGSGTWSTRVPGPSAAPRWPWTRRGLRTSAIITPGGGDLKYARWDGSQWVLETVDGLGDNHVIGQSSSLALDVNRFPHIAYTDKTGNLLKYAYWDGGQWVLGALSSARNFGTSLALDTDESPHIAFCGGSYDLLYATRVVEERRLIYLPLVVTP